MQWLVSFLDSSCSWNQFACSANKCISKQWTCDGEDDCGDGLDESDAICGKQNNFSSVLCWIMHTEGDQVIKEGGGKGARTATPKSTRFKDGVLEDILNEQLDTFLWGL